MSLIKALRKDKAFLADIEYHKHGSEEFNCWWLGQSGFLVQYKGQRLLLDPYLSDSLTKKYENTNKPHTRMSERVIDPALLAGINRNERKDQKACKKIMKQFLPYFLINNLNFVSYKFGAHQFTATI